VKPMNSKRNGAKNQKSYRDRKAARGVQCPVHGVPLRFRFNLPFLRWGGGGHNSPVSDTSGSDLVEQGSFGCSTAIHPIQAGISILPFAKLSPYFPFWVRTNEAQNGGVERFAFHCRG